MKMTNKDSFIKRRMVEFNDLFELQDDLIAYQDSFNYAGLKGLIFTEDMECIDEMIALCEEVDHLNPISIWNEDKEDCEMLPHELSVLDYLIKYGTLPDPYNILVIDRVLEELDIYITEPSMNLVIINDSNPTIQAQIRDRFLHDVDFVTIEKDKK